MQHVTHYMQHLQQHRAPSTVNQYTYRLRKVLSMPQVQQQLAQGAAQQLLGVITQRQQAAGAAAGTPAQPTASAGPGRGRRRSSAAAKPSQEPQAHPAPHHQGDQHMDDAPAHHMHDAPDQHMHDAADTAEHGGLGNRLVSADVAATKHSPAQPKALASAADGQRLLDPAGTTAAAAEAEAAAAAAAAAAAHNASATAVMRAEESLPDHFAPLQPSRDQKRRFYSLMNQLARLTPGDIRLDKFWCDKDVSALCGLGQCWHGHATVQGSGWPILNGAAWLVCQVWSCWCTCLGPGQLWHSRRDVCILLCVAMCAFCCCAVAGRVHATGPVRATAHGRSTNSPAKHAGQHHSGTHNSSPCRQYCSTSSGRR